MTERYYTCFWKLSNELKGNRIIQEHTIESFPHGLISSYKKEAIFTFGRVPIFHPHFHSQFFSNRIDISRILLYDFKM